eukprot:571612-Amphidinium_carterae.3
MMALQIMCVGLAGTSMMVMDKARQGCATTAGHFHSTRSSDEKFGSKSLGASLILPAHRIHGSGAKKYHRTDLQHCGAYLRCSPHVTQSLLTGFSCRAWAGASQVAWLPRQGITVQPWKANTFVQRLQP